MKKRNLAAFLWFFSGWTLGSIVAFFAGLPWVLGPMLAVLLATGVWWDPAGLFWPQRDAGPAPGGSRMTEKHLAR